MSGRRQGCRVPQPAMARLAELLRDGRQELPVNLDLANLHGVGGALLDIERERVELIKFNLFDNPGTYRSTSPAVRASRVRR